MAKHTCAICGAEVGLISEQKLADGNFICRKVCVKKCMKIFNKVEATLDSVNAHIEQVEYGTKVWNQIFEPLKKAKKKEEKLEEIKRVEVLYIDDLFKTKDDIPPTAADINIAFEVINYRYNNPELITIISCQQMFAELLTVDEATASRIAEMCGEYSLSIARDIKRNYRLKGMIGAI